MASSDSPTGRFVFSPPLNPLSQTGGIVCLALLCLLSGLWLLGWRLLGPGTYSFAPPPFWIWPLFFASALLASLPLAYVGALAWGHYLLRKHPCAVTANEDGVTLLHASGDEAPPGRLPIEAVTSVRMIHQTAEHPDAEVGVGIELDFDDDVISDELRERLATSTTQNGCSFVYPILLLGCRSEANRFLGFWRESLPAGCVADDDNEGLRRDLHYGDRPGRSVTLALVGVAVAWVAALVVLAMG